MASSFQTFLHASQQGRDHLRLQIKKQARRVYERRVATTSSSRPHKYVLSLPLQSLDPYR